MRASEKTNQYRALAGLALTVGMLLLADAIFISRLGADLWPMRIIVPGMVLFFGTLFMAEEIGVPLAIVSSVTTTTGLILLGHQLTDYWATWAYSWTLPFPTAIGLGMLAYGLAKSRSNLIRAGWSLTKVGLGMCLTLAIFFEGILGLGGFHLAFGWPLLLVSLGLFLFTLKGFDLSQFDQLLTQ